MADSDLENDLFGDSASEEDLDTSVPDYVDQADFKEFCKNEGIRVDPNLGFIQLQTFKPYYFNGQVVRGYAVLTAFKKIKAKDMYIKVVGYEEAGDKTESILKNLKETASVHSKRRASMAVSNSS